MKKCPHCGKEVEEFRGDCPHCSENMDAEGLRELMLEQRGEQKKVYDEIAELRKKEEDNEARLKAIEERMMKRAEELAAMEQGELERPKPVNFGKVVRALASQKDIGMDAWKRQDAIYELEIIQKAEEELRALSTGAIGTGGAIIPPEYLGQEMVDLLRANVIVEALGARVLTGLMGTPVYIPRLAGGATAYHVGENNSKTPSDQTFEQISMTPHEVAAATIFSKRMAMLSNPSVDMMIQEDLLAVLARSVDFEAIYGNGAGNRPIGIINQPGVTAYTLANDVGNGAIPIPVDIDDIQYALEQNNAFMGSLGWAFNPRTKYTIKKMRDESGGAGTNTGGWLFRQDIKEGNVDGIMFKDTTQIPVNLTKGANNDCSHIVFANWSDLVLAYWGGMEIATSDQAGDTFLKNQVIIKVAMLYDVALRHPESFCVVDGVRA